MQAACPAPHHTPPNTSANVSRRKYRSLRRRWCPPTRAPDRKAVPIRRFQDYLENIVIVCFFPVNQKAEEKRVCRSSSAFVHSNR